MSNHTKKVDRLDRNIIADIVNSPNLMGSVPEDDQAEMAIPSYLHSNPFIRAMFWRRYDAVYRLSELRPDLVVCEFGCGIGAFLPTLTKEVAKTYAVDLYPQFAHKLAQKLGLEVEFSEDMSNIPDGSLDLVIAVEVMEHLDDPVAYTQQFARKLRPGGRLIMSAPTESWLYKLGRFLIGYNKYHDYHEHNAYQLRKMISENGFNLQKTIRYPSLILPLFLICPYQVADNKPV
jgi:2-polyprenyl-3-methyl-5-hydroxy-6-metoxy-1,4-benzoquinol methylase